MRLLSLLTWLSGEMLKPQPGMAAWEAQQRLRQARAGSRLCCVLSMLWGDLSSLLYAPQKFTQVDGTSPPSLLPRRIRRAAPSAAQWQKCISTTIWYAKGTQRAPARAGSSLRDHTGTLVVYSGRGDRSAAQMCREGRLTESSSWLSQAVKSNSSLRNLLPILSCLSCSALNSLCHGSQCLTLLLESCR